MESTLRKHITLPKATLDFLEDYQQQQGLPNFSATIEAAANALKKQSVIAGYEQFAADYAVSNDMKKEAEVWLEHPMEEK
jgi:hypothetical protein